MDNARKKYINIKKLSIGDNFALLDSAESDDEGDIKNIMNDSDTVFVAEDESVISTNMIRKEEISNQSRSISVPEASIHIFSTQKEDETNTLGQNEPNSVLITQRTSNYSPSTANQRTSDQSPAAVFTTRTSNQSSKSTALPTVLQKIKKQKESSMIKYCTKIVQIRSYSGPHFSAFGLNTER